MISTATALELLGPTFRYPTRLLGASPTPTASIHGDVYLLGSYDPTLAAARHRRASPTQLARARHQARSTATSSSAATRRATASTARSSRSRSPAGEPGQPPTAIDARRASISSRSTITAKTDEARRKRHRLTYKTETIVERRGPARASSSRSAARSARAARRCTRSTRASAPPIAAHALRAALRAHGITVTGDMRVMELGDFVGDSVGAGGAARRARRHESRAARRHRRARQQVERQLARRPRDHDGRRAVAPHGAVDGGRGRRDVRVARAPPAARARTTSSIDTGSGLSYRTRITPQEMVDDRARRRRLRRRDTRLRRSRRRGSTRSSIAGTDGTLRTASARPTCAATSAARPARCRR